MDARGLCKDTPFMPRMIIQESFDRVGRHSEFFFMTHALIGVMVHKRMLLSSGSIAENTCIVIR